MPSWPRSCASWIYNYLCNQCISALMLWVRISIRAKCTTLCDKVCQWLATGRWFSPGPAVSSTNKADRHDITEVLLKVALNTTKQAKQNNWGCIKKSAFICIFPEKISNIYYKFRNTRKICFWKESTKGHHSLVGITFDQRSKIFKHVFENIGLACIS
jgi:hypothetical protein